MDEENKPPRFSLERIMELNKAMVKAMDDMNRCRIEAKHGGIHRGRRPHTPRHIVRMRTR